MRKIIVISICFLLLVGCGRGRDRIDTNSVDVNNSSAVVDESDVVQKDGESAVSKDVVVDFGDALDKLNSVTTSDINDESSDVNINISPEVVESDSIQESTTAGSVVINNGVVESLPDYITELNETVVDKPDKMPDVEFNSSMIDEAAPGFLNDVKNGYVNVENAINNHVALNYADVKDYKVNVDNSVSSIAIQGILNDGSVVVIAVITKYTYNNEKYIEIDKL